MFAQVSSKTGSLRRDVLGYYVYEATAAITLYRPVMFLYFRALGFSWTQIAILEAVGSLVRVTTEVPTGYAGDRIGRRNAMLAGTAMIAVALGGIAAAGSFSVLLACYLLWSFGWNFRRGVDSAWLYDRLAAADRTGQFAAIRGRAKAGARGFGVVCALVGGVLGARALSLPFFAAAFVTAAGIPALLVMRNVEGHREREHPIPRESAAIVRKTLTTPSLAPFVLYYFVLFASVVAVVFMYEQPVVRDLAADLGYGGPPAVLLGVFYAAICSISGVLSFHTGFIAERIGLRRWFAAVPLAVGAGLVGLLFVPVLAVPAILLARGVADVTETLAGQYVNDRLQGVARATVLSTMILVSSLAAIPFQLASGRLADSGFTADEVLVVAGPGSSDRPQRAQT